jgi:hypothetical protein
LTFHVATENPDVVTVRALPILWNPGYVIRT